jgi:hypothetical protein
MRFNVLDFNLKLVPPPLVIPKSRVHHPSSHHPVMGGGIPSSPALLIPDAGPSTVVNKRAW